MWSEDVDFLTTPERVAEIADQAERRSRGTPGESGGQKNDRRRSGRREQPSEATFQAGFHAFAERR